MTPEQAKELEATMERHAPAGYDPASDDMTIPFAVKLAEQDEKIERLRAALQEIEAMFSIQKNTQVAGLDGSRRVGEIYEIANTALSGTR